MRWMFGDFGPEWTAFYSLDLSLRFMNMPFLWCLPPLDARCRLHFRASGNVASYLARLHCRRPWSCYVWYTWLHWHHAVELRIRHLWHHAIHLGGHAWLVINPRKCCDVRPPYRRTSSHLRKFSSRWYYCSLLCRHDYIWRQIYSLTCCWSERCYCHRLRGRHKGHHWRYPTWNECLLSSKRVTLTLSLQKTGIFTIWIFLECEWKMVHANYSGNFIFNIIHWVYLCV